MNNISKSELQALRKLYPNGSRVELIAMDDPYNRTLEPGCRGTVLAVDNIGTIHVDWDCGSSLGIAYGTDFCRKITE